VAVLRDVVRGVTVVVDHERRAMWNANAAAWTELSRAGFDIYRDLVNTPAFFAMLPSVAARSRLNLGCGEGHNTRLLAERGAKVVALDVADAFVAAAAAAGGSDVRFVVGDGATLVRLRDRGVTVRPQAREPGTASESTPPAHGQPRLKAWRLAPPIAQPPTAVAATGVHAAVEDGASGSDTTVTVLVRARRGGTRSPGRGAPSRGRPQPAR
jgi:Methyltransferase domain